MIQVQYDNQLRTLKEISDMKKISVNTLYYRYNHGLALTEYHNDKRCTLLLTHDGKCMSIIEWSKELGVQVETILYRIDRGYDISNILKAKRAKTSIKCASPDAVCERNIKHQISVRFNISEQMCNNILQLLIHGTTCRDMAEYAQKRSSIISGILRRMCSQGYIKCDKKIYSCKYAYYLNVYHI